MDDELKQIQSELAAVIPIEKVERTEAVGVVTLVSPRLTAFANVKAELERVLAKMWDARRLLLFPDRVGWWAAVAATEAGVPFDVIAPWPSLRVFPSHHDEEWPDLDAEVFRASAERIQVVTQETRMNPEPFVLARRWIMDDASQMVLVSDGRRRAGPALARTLVRFGEAVVVRPDGSPTERIIRPTA